MVVIYMVAYWIHITFDLEIDLSLSLTMDCIYKVLIYGLHFKYIK